VQDFAVRLTLGTHPWSKYAIGATRRFVRHGSSPRGAQALVILAKIHALLNDRLHVSCDDIRSVAHSALRHRILLNFEGEAERVETDAVVTALVESTPEAE
jgi:MoxR-like ATPase